MGNLFLDLGSFEEAKLYYAKAIDADPTRSVYYSNYGYILYIQRKYREAEWYFLKAIEFDNRNPAYYNTYG